MTVSPAAPGLGVPAPYDFRRPMTLAREHARTLEVALGTFSRQWANQLLARLGVATQTTLERVGMCTYDEYVSALPTPTTLVVFATGPHKRPAVVQFPLDAALSWVDRMLGGPGTPGAVAERELTDIEQALINELMTHVLADLDYSFTEVAPIDPELRRIQHTPQLLQATASTTAVIAATFTIHVADHAVPATLMLPAEWLLTAMRESHDADQRNPEQEAAEQLQRELLDRAVQHAPVEVSVRLAPVPVNPRKVAGLAVGDVLPLHHPRSQPMDVMVGDRVLAQAVAGTNGSRLAGLVVNVKENS